jgi:hypothetical protein
MKETGRGKPGERLHSCKYKEETNKKRYEGGFSDAALSVKGTCSSYSPGERLHSCKYKEETFLPVDY